MERTNLSEEKGKWLFVYKKTNVHNISDFLNKELQLLYQHVIPSKLWFEHMPQPKCTSCRATKAVGTYVATLTGMANPQEVNDAINIRTNRQAFNLRLE
eukprot:11677622-Ditylum_brightwellii.AAC.1